MFELTLRKIGNSVGTSVPKSLMDAMRVEQGDTLYVQQRDDGSFTIAAFDPAELAQFEAARKVLSRDRVILAALL